MQTDMQILNIFMGLVACLFGLLCTLLGWLGKGMFEKMDNLRASMNEMASDLHDRLNNLDRRVTVVETRCQTSHKD